MFMTSISPSKRISLREFIKTEGKRFLHRVSVQGKVHKEEYEEAQTDFQNIRRKPIYILTVFNKFKTV